MLETCFKQVLRSIRKNPLFSLINLGGLSVGMAASFLLLTYVQREKNADTQFPNADRIVRISADFFHMGGIAKSQLQLAPLMAASCKEIAAATALDRSAAPVPVRLSPNDRAYTDIHPYYIDPAFFKVFAWQTSAGALPAGGLKPGQTILSQEEAHHFFGDLDPIGRPLFIGDGFTPCRVIAVLKNDFRRSHLAPEILLPMTAPLRAGYSDNWNTPAVYNYALLKPSGTMAGLDKWLDKALEKIVYPSALAQTSAGRPPAFRDWKNSNAATQFIVQPLESIWLHSRLALELTPGGNPIQVRLLFIIAIFLLLLSVVSYTNLITTQAATRLCETGMKKILGATRTQLAGQIILQSILYCLIAAAFAAILIQLALLGYRLFTDVRLPGAASLLLQQDGWLLALALPIGILTGIYQALYITRISAIQAVRSQQGSSSTSLLQSQPFPNNNVFVFQFSVAAVLLLASFTIYGQMQYMQHKDSGFRDNNILLVNDIQQLGDNLPAFRQELASQPFFIDASCCSRTPGDSGLCITTYQTPALPANLTIQTFPVDEHYLETFGLHLQVGRNFDKHLLTDTNALIVNESAAAALGIPNPVGTRLNGAEQIIGVVKDFHFTGLHEKIAPLIFRYRPQGATLAIHVKTGHTADCLHWLHVYMQDRKTPQLPIRTIDDDWQHQNAGETLLIDCIHGATVLGIFLSVLGLTGLFLLTTRWRKREFGIRKAMGAHSLHIFLLLSRGLITRTLVACCLALPFSWWLMHGWLHSFFYHVVGDGFSAILPTAAVLLPPVLLLSAIFSRKIMTTLPAKDLRPN